MEERDSYITEDQEKMVIEVLEDFDSCLWEKFQRRGIGKGHALIAFLLMQNALFLDSLEEMVSRKIGGDGDGYT